jgi:hypothetical protein
MYTTLRMSTGLTASAHVNPQFLAITRTIRPLHMRCFLKGTC